MLDTRPVETSEALQPFRVWLRPMGESWRIAVEAGHEAKWLIEKLAEHGFRSVDLIQDANDLHCTFRCPTRDRDEKKRVEELLGRLPEVQVQLTPEYSPGKSGAALSPHLSLEPLHQPAHPKNIAAEIGSFRVWIRPLGNAWKVCTESAVTEEWLRLELEHRGLTCSESLVNQATSMHVFRCMSETPHEASYVWNLLKALPQVLLQNDPA